MKIKKCPLDLTDLVQEFISFPSSLPYHSLYELVGKTGIEKELSAENEFFSHGEALAFLCYDQGKVVGRILASVDYNLKDQRIGHFGYLEVIDNPEVTIQLLQAASDWLQNKGKTILEGPFDLHLFNRYRLQIAGFEYPPLLAEPRSLPYYANHLTQAGLTITKKWYSRHATCQQLQTFHQHLRQRIDARPSVSTDYILIPMNFSKVDQELVSIYNLMMHAWEDNVGFSRIPLSEFVDTYLKLVPLTHDKLCLKAIDTDGQWIGCIISFYNTFSVPLLTLQQNSYSPSLADEVLVYMVVTDTHVRGKGILPNMFAKLIEQIAYVEKKNATFMLAMDEVTIIQILPSPNRIHALYQKYLSHL